MSYGFGQKPTDAVQLPVQLPAQPQPQSREAVAKRPAMSDVLQAGAELGFISRDAGTRRKPGPRRTEPQDKITVTGPKRVIERLKAYCDRAGEPSYCTAIERLLDMVEKGGK